MKKEEEPELPAETAVKTLREELESLKGKLEAERKASEGLKAQRSELAAKIDSSIKQVTLRSKYNCIRC